MGNVMYVILISDMQYPAAEVDFVHAMYKAGSGEKCMTARPLAYMHIQEPHGGPMAGQSENCFMRGATHGPGEAISGGQPWLW